MSWKPLAIAAGLALLAVLVACGIGAPTATTAASTATPPAAAAAVSPSPVTPLAATPSPVAGNPGDTRTRPADGMVMVYVPAGAFPMGSTEAQVEAGITLCREHYSICNQWYYDREAPQHTVSVDSFLLDQTEVTNAQFRRCVEADACSEPVDCTKGEPTYPIPEFSDHPVVCVDWSQAQAYCRWADARLPTEAEWEYAFRGEQGAIFPWGDSFDGARLNYCDTNCEQTHADVRYDDAYVRTAPVTAFPQDASWCGALDMSGNVSEWVADWFGAYDPEESSNPAGPPAGEEKLIKGCSWFNPPAYCRGTARASAGPDTIRFDYLGFRCAMSVPGT